MATAGTVGMRHPSPAEQMREMLADGRRRGLAFEHAWRHSRRSVKWPHDRQSRVEWKAAIDETMGFWHDCYMRRGDGIDVTVLVDAISMDEIPEPMGD